MHKLDRTNSAVPLVSAPTPKMGWKETLVPGATFFISGVATGEGGAATVGVMVAFANWPVESAITYFTGAA